MARLVRLTANKAVFYVNPEAIAYIRENVGRMTYIAFRAGVDAQHGEMPFLLVDGEVDAVAEKLSDPQDHKPRTTRSVARGSQS